MQKFEITGGSKIDGVVHISGAKNAALPILMTSLLTDETCHYSNVPELADIHTTLMLLERMGANIDRQPFIPKGTTADLPQASQTTQISRGHIAVQAKQIAQYTAPFELVKAMRASILVMGPLLAKYGKVKIALPGGCAIGSRPVDMHINGLKLMGATVTESDGFLLAEAKNGLIGANLKLDKVSVGATENLIMAATLAKGDTTITNAAREPEVVDLCHCLIGMGAKIQGVGTSKITVNGVPQLNGALHKVQPDRIEAGTYLAAAAITKGHLLVKDTDPTVLVSVIEKLKQAGAEVKTGSDWIALNMKGKRAKSVDIETAPYPGFPTDLQPQFMALNAVASGHSTIKETIFENRFMQVNELNKMGARIKISGNQASISGVSKLHGKSVMSTDLRASASLVLASLVTDGISEVEKICHTDRGYVTMEKKLSQIGANIKRIQTHSALSA